MPVWTDPLSYSAGLGVGAADWRLQEILYLNEIYVNQRCAWTVIL